MKYKIIEFKRKKTLKEIFFPDNDFNSFMDLENIFNMIPDEVNYNDDADGKLFGVISPDTNFLNIFKFKNSNAKISNPSDLSNSEYLFSINTKFYNDTTTLVDSKLRKITKAFSKVKSNELNISKSFCHAFFGMIRERFMSLIFKSEGEKSIAFLLQDIIANTDNYVFDFQQRLDEYFDISITSDINKTSFIVNLSDADRSFEKQSITINQALKYTVLNKDNTTNPNSYGEFSSDTNFSAILSDFSKSLLDTLKDSEFLNTKVEDGQDNNERKMQIISTIVNTYAEVDSNYIIRELESLNNIEIRKTFSNVNELLNQLNDSKFDFLRSLKQKGGGQGDAKGKGEAIVHLLANTTNVCTRIEPDAVISFGDGSTKRFSIKSMSSGNAQTGVKLPQNISSKYAEFLNTLIDRIPTGVSVNSSFIYAIMFNALMSDQEVNINIENKLNEFNKKFSNESLSANTINKIINQYKKIKDSGKKVIDTNAVISTYNAFKKEILKEHNPDFCLIHKDNEFELIDLSSETLDKVTIIKSIGSDNRISFVAGKSCIEKSVFNSQHDFGNKIFNNNKNPSEFEAALHHLVDKINNMPSDDKADETINGVNDSNDNVSSIDDSELKDKVNNHESFLVRGNLLKEVYSSLFKKSLIVEGGLGGHMMHPYEMLDSTPREMINQIKRYSLPQTIVEKVDGQNLFFTVERDGTLLFARNKEDMTHDDLIEKFRGHGAEKPFVEGGNAIKNGVEQGLTGREEEVIAIFHPSESVRSFINFEIMHPEKPNQIRYDQKYIVFHSIVDYKEGRVQVGSSSTDERITRLINLTRSGIESSGFILASNQTVDLNTLEDVQISEYEDRIIDASSALRISDDQTFADGIMNMISDELRAEGVSISDEALSILRDYVIYGEDETGRKIHSKEFTKIISKEDAAKLRSLGLTTSTKVMSKIGRILTPFKDIFVDLGIDLLKGVKSSYMSDDYHLQNIETIKDKLQTAIDDIDRYTSEVAEENWSNTIIRLMPHVRKVKQKGIENIVASSVEGGVYSHDNSLMKLTGGFAPMNQIVGAAYRDSEGIFSEFKSKFMQNEGSRKSLKGVFSLIF